MRPSLTKIDNYVEIMLGDEPLVKAHRCLLKSEVASWDVDSKQEFFAKFWPLEQKVAFRLALHKLARKAMHSQELKLRLKQNFFSDQAIEYAIAEAERLGMIQDSDYVAHLTERLSRQGKSRQQILAKCSQLGIAKSDVALTKESEVEALRRLIVKRYPLLLQKNASTIEKQKVMRALSMRGFSFSLITCVLKDE